MPLQRKVLWVIDVHSQSREGGVMTHAAAAGCDTVCLRTTSRRLPDAIGRFHAAGMRVYAWRWPAVVPQPNSTTHYFALDEAEFVVQRLIPAGLDGYIADPESDAAGQKNDWNQTALQQLAQEFCARISNAAPAGFVFGTTSGCSYPRPNNRPQIPWAQFVAASAILLPQTYWRMDTGNSVISINGGTPSAAADRGIAAWTPIASARPIRPMAGEIAVVSAAQIAAYGQKLESLGVTEGHFYTDTPDIPPANLMAIRAL
jgi:hypothetical protein